MEFHGPARTKRCGIYVLNTHDFFQMFIDGDLLKLVEAETKRYGVLKAFNFAETNKEELKNFIAIRIQMGLIRMLSLRDYWSARAALGCHSIAGKTMPRKRPQAMRLIDLRFC
ncbi:hypothetical protein TELCIR_02559 [Teladorsagia circumcincta]|uniref:PiggyBac transposable element-derived protein domain-containing protein n=1 Tax=Teladorsagia circumcincta TaxID=45464 RepID=A0A2G9UYV1_TELCI|nr:hypothetical protein TELCIR_02559 [Teladorsagia circumcincta]